MTTDTMIDNESPFHIGEKAIQERLGIRDRMEQIGQRVIRDYMPDSHRELYGKLPFLIVGSVDAEGQPWASIVTGKPGFMQASERELNVASRLHPNDPLRANLAPGASVGILGIELETRRRNRMSGRVLSLSETGFALEVVQSFGNCPKYIQVRQHRFVDENDPKPQPLEIETELLSDAGRDLVMASDTLFVASKSGRLNASSPAEGVDASHRGGKPGFVRVTERDKKTILTIPDFAGNGHFNTFGNLMVQPRCGLLFVDFATGDVLQLTGLGQIVWDSPEINRFAGAERLLEVTVTGGRWLRAAVPLRWGDVELAPQLPATGDWPAATSVFQEKARSVIITSITNESPTVRSFWLRAKDGAPLPDYRPGQFLPLDIPSASGAVARRTYTISDRNGPSAYRISVKKSSQRDASASVWLHEHAAVGTEVRFYKPSGSFVLQPSEDPVVLMSAGIGITPMLAMLKQLAEQNVRREVLFVHSTQTPQSHAFRDEVNSIAQGRGNIKVISFYSHLKSNEALQTAAHAGRMTPSLLAPYSAPLIPFDAYMCGPSSFMQSAYDMLVELGVADTRIYAEAFGPSALKRVAKQSSVRPEVVGTVTFSKSGKTAGWDTTHPSILDFAEAQGLSPDFSCRVGACGMCATSINKGKVRYVTAPTAEIAAGQVLICCSVPDDPEVALDI